MEEVLCDKRASGLDSFQGKRVQSHTVPFWGKDVVIIKVS